MKISTSAIDETYFLRFFSWIDRGFEVEKLIFFFGFRKRRSVRSAGVVSPGLILEKQMRNHLHRLLLNNRTAEGYTAQLVYRQTLRSHRPTSTFQLRIFALSSFASFGRGEADVSINFSWKSKLGNIIPKQLIVDHATTIDFLRIWR